jgi:hypothetical protein
MSRLPSKNESVDLMSYVQPKRAYFAPKLAD